MADGIADALIQVWPDRFASRNACVETLTQMFPAVSDVSSDEMIKAIRQALTRDGLSGSPGGFGGTRNRASSAPHSVRAAIGV